MLYWLLALFGISCSSSGRSASTCARWARGWRSRPPSAGSALNRKAECKTCHACPKGCGSLAIDAAGRIDQRECLLCLDCMVLYYDTHACPPLVKERKRREVAADVTRSAGRLFTRPLTPIDPRWLLHPAICGWLNGKGWRAFARRASVLLAAPSWPGLARWPSRAAELVVRLGQCWSLPPITRRRRPRSPATP